MKTRKLLLCGHQARPEFIGGAELKLLTIMDCMDRKRFDPVFLTNAEGRVNDGARSLGIPVLQSDYEAFWDFLAPGRNTPAAFRAFLEREQKPIDSICGIMDRLDPVAVVSNCTVNFTPLVAARRTGRPAVLLVNEIPYAFDRMAGPLRRARRRVVARLPGGSRDTALRFLRDQIMVHAKAAIFVSEISRRALFPSLPTTYPTACLHPPVRRTIFDAPPGSCAFAGIPDGAFAVVFLGIVARHKGVHDFVEAALKLAGKRKRIHFTVAGGTPDRGYEARLQRAVRAAGAEERFLFTGFLDDPLPLYDRADVVCMPSLYDEPFGKVVTEAMARGRPVVAYETGGVSEIISDGENGFLVPRGDTESLARRIAYLQETPSVCRSIGDAAKRHAIRHYDPRRYVKDVQEILDRVIAVD